MKNYTIWTSHGKKDMSQVDCPDAVEVGCNTYHPSMNLDTVDHNDDNDDEEDDILFDFEELLRHVEPQVLTSMGVERGLDNMKVLEKASNDLLYEESKGCDKEFTMLRAVLQLIKLKASNGWSDSSFTKLLSLLAKILPKPNKIPATTYRSKKLICLLSLGVKKYMLSKSLRVISQRV